MSSERPRRRLILCDASEESFVPLTRAILAKMGYTIILAEEIPRLPPALVGRPPDLRIVDERRLGEIGPAAHSDPPLIVLTGPKGVGADDRRILGAVRKPAGLHELYRLIQQAFEENPRSAPRVYTNIPSSCRYKGQEWQGTVLSLSESGCLLRSPTPLQMGSEITLSFELPPLGPIETSAEIAYQLPPDLGLVFCSAPAASRDAIRTFVEQALAAA
jgi:hypothetical protein